MSQIFRTQNPYKRCKVQNCRPVFCYRLTVYITDTLTSADTLPPHTHTHTHTQEVLLNWLIWDIKLPAFPPNIGSIYYCSTVGASCLFVLLYFGFLSYGFVVSPSWRNLVQNDQQSLPGNLYVVFFIIPTITCTGTSDVTNTFNPGCVLLPSSLKLLWPEILISKLISTMAVLNCSSSS
jgi:hypothetical protein